jgi:NAD(P)-dependent dehydrogenase (short-subunit alcohol dehydrogenase family)
VQADVSQLGELDAVLSAVGPRCDVLINNTGTNFNVPLAKFTAEAFSKVVTVNLTAVFATTRAFLPLLREAASAARPARVINVASIEGISPPSLETCDRSH